MSRSSPRLRTRHRGSRGEPWATRTANARARNDVGRVRDLRNGRRHRRDVAARAGRGRQGALLGEPARWGGVRPRAGGRGAARSGRARRESAPKELREGGRAARGDGALRRRVLRLQPEGVRHHGPAAPALPRVLLGGAGERGPHARALRRAHRGLRRLRDGQLLLLQPLLESGAGAGRGDVPPAPHRQRQGLPRVARVLSARSARARHRHPDGLLDVAGRRPSGVPKPALTRVRHGPRGRGDHRTAPPARLPLSRGRDSVADRALPRVRSPRAGDGVRLRLRRGGAQKADRRARRRRRHPRRDPRLGRQQRRLVQGELPGAERRRAGGVHGGGLRCRPRRSTNRRVRGVPRDGHLLGRSDRGGGAHAGLPHRDRRARLLPHRLGEEQHRAPRHRRRRRQLDQGDAGARARRDPAHAQLRAAQPDHRLRRQPLSGRGPPHALAGTERPSPPRSGELARRRRDERARGAAGAAGPADARRGLTAGSAPHPLGEEHGQPRRRAGAAGGPSACPS